MLEDLREILPRVTISAQRDRDSSSLLNCHDPVDQLDILRVEFSLFDAKQERLQFVILKIHELLRLSQGCTIHPAPRSFPGSPSAADLSPAAGDDPGDNASACREARRIRPLMT